VKTEYDGSKRFNVKLGKNGFRQKERINYTYLFFNGEANNNQICTGNYNYIIFAS
jgi:hypothetical protein